MTVNCLRMIYLLNVHETSEHAGINGLTLSEMLKIT